MGILLAFIVAASHGVKDVLIKGKTGIFHPTLIGWSWRLFSLIILIPIAIYFGVPELNKNFWIASSITIMLNTITTLLYAHSLKNTDVSLATPMLAISPIITAGLSYLVNGELPSTFGWVGIIFMAIGLYLLNFKKKQKDFLTPIKAVVHNKGARYMASVGVIWGITSTFDKTAVVNSSPVFYTTYVAVMLTLTLGLIILLTKKKGNLTNTNKKSIKSLAPIGVIDGIANLLQMIAISFTVTAYVIAIKRSSILFGSILAKIFMGEKIEGRVFPIIVIITGLVLLILS